MSGDAKVPFGREYTPAPDKVGLKLTNERSMFAKAAASKQEFEAGADKLMDTRQNRNKRALDLARQFLSLLHDKTLPVNKSSIVTDVEQDIKNKLLELALEINNDENEPNEGMGSIAIISLLIKSILIHRDTINGLDYKVAQLEKKLVQLEKQRSSQAAADTSNVKTD